MSRNENGQFAKGNPGGPGNPYGRRTADMRSQMLSAITDADVKAVAGKLVDKAKEGDLAAIKLLLSYTVGRPDAAPDPDRVDISDRLITEERRRLKRDAEMDAILDGAG